MGRNGGARSGDIRETRPGDAVLMIDSGYMQSLEPSARSGRRRAAASRLPIGTGELEQVGYNLRAVELRRRVRSRGMRGATAPRSCTQG